MPIVNVPNIGSISFPEGMPPEEIQRTIETEIASRERSRGAPEAPLSQEYRDDLVAGMEPSSPLSAPSTAAPSPDAVPVTPTAPVSEPPPAVAAPMAVGSPEWIAAPDSERLEKSTVPWKTVAGQVPELAKASTIDQPIRGDRLQSLSEELEAAKQGKPYSPALETRATGGMGLSMGGMGEAQQALANAKPRPIKEIQSDIDAQMKDEAKWQKRSQELAKEMEGSSTFQRGAQQAAVSAPQTGMALGVGLLAGPTAAALSMYPLTQAQAYADLRGQGVSHEVAKVHSHIQGAAESGTEIFEFGALLNKVPGFNWFLKNLLTEEAGETAAQLIQGASSEVAVRQAHGEEVTGKMLVESTMKAAEQLPETWVATALGTAVQTGTVHLVDKVISGKPDEKDADLIQRANEAYVTTLADAMAELSGEKMPQSVRKKEAERRAQEAALHVIAEFSPVDAAKLKLDKLTKDAAAGKPVDPAELEAAREAHEQALTESVRGKLKSGELTPEQQQAAAQALQEIDGAEEEGGPTPLKGEVRETAPKAPAAAEVSKVDKVSGKVAKAAEPLSEVEEARHDALTRVANADTIEEEAVHDLIAGGLAKINPQTQRPVLLPAGKRQRIALTKRVEAAEAAELAEKEAAKPKPVAAKPQPVAATPQSVATKPKRAAARKPSRDRDGPEADYVPDQPIKAEPMDEPGPPPAGELALKPLAEMTPAEQKKLTKRQRTLLEREGKQDDVQFATRDDRDVQETLVTREGEVLKVGHKTKDFRGNDVEVVAIDPPRSAASSGHITLRDAAGNERSVYPGSIDAEWKPTVQDTAAKANEHPLFGKLRPGETVEERVDPETGAISHVLTGKLSDGELAWLKALRADGEARAAKSEKARAKRKQKKLDKAGAANVTALDTSKNTSRTQGDKADVLTFKPRDPQFSIAEERQAVLDQKEPGSAQAGVKALLDRPGEREAAHQRTQAIQNEMRAAPKEQYVITEHGSRRDNVILRTGDKVEAQAKLKALLTNDPEGKYSVTTEKSEGHEFAGEEPQFSLAAEALPAEGTPHLAPNGKPSKLTRAQWQQVRTPEFKAWFGDWEEYALLKGGVWNDGEGMVSKVVDENGEPLVVYHGTKKGGFRNFDNTKQRWAEVKGTAFFTDNRHMARTYSGTNHTEIQLEDVPEGFTVIQNEDGKWTTVFNGEADGDFATQSEAEAFAREQGDQIYGEEANLKRGLYSIFLNIRSPLEEDFEGANWDGSRTGMWEVVPTDEYGHRDLDADPVYTLEGRRYFPDQREAEDYAELTGRGVAMPAMDHYRTTNGAASEALRESFYDGAIMRNVIDEGPDGWGGNDPSDVFVATKAGQIKSATQNRGTFDKNDDDITFATAPMFYSALTQAGVNAKIEKGTGTQWYGVLRNTPGVKTEELDWSSVKEWLGDRKGVTKAEVTDYLRANEIKVEETVRGDTQAFEDKAREMGYMDARRVTGEDKLPKPAKFDRPDLNTPGGEAGTYRELLLRLPERPRKPLPEGYSVRDGILRDADGDAVSVGSDAYARLGGDNFTGGHWDEENVLAHVRFHTRQTSADGISYTPPENTLFIDEMQSDWHQRGRKQGYRGKAQTEPVVREDENVFVVSFPDGRSIDVPKKGITAEDAKKVAELIRKDRPNAGFSTPQSAVPDAPFKTTWPELSLKRMIRWAAENGFDRVAWTSGDMQNERYDLSKQVDSIMVEVYGAGGKGQLYNITAYKDGRDVVAERAIAEDKIEDYIGKDAAEKALARIADGDERAVLQGLDLTIGGKGMQGFYDKILVDAANKIGKKYGAKVGKLAINPRGDMFTTHDRGLYAELRWDIVDDNGLSQITTPFESRLDAEDAAEAMNSRGGDTKTQQAHSLPLTPALREAALGGLPMFAAGGQGGGMTYWEGRAAVDEVDAALGTDTMVVATQAELPPRILANVPAGRRVRGVHDHGRLWVVAENHSSILDIQNTAYHEAVGHKGLQALLGDRYDEVMDQIARDFPAEVKKAEWQNVLDASTDRGRRKSAEEAVAYAAGELLGNAGGKDQRSIWRKMVDYVRAAILSHRPLMKMNQNDFNALIYRAREAVIREVRRENAGTPKYESAVRTAAANGAPQPTPDPVNDGPLLGMPVSTVIPGQGTVKMGPHIPARKAAAAYKKSSGIDKRDIRMYVKVNEATSKRIARAYGSMKHDPLNPKVATAYKAMVAETLAQYQAIKATGLKVEFIHDGQNPYAASPRMAIEDVRNNNHLWVFPTDSGFGGDDPNAEYLQNNPLLEKTDEYVGRKQLLANDVFRIVHDYFGHIKEGNGFRADGEENAWRIHAMMYSPLARAAMTSETRGQNSWLNFGPHGAKNRNAKSEDTVYAEQKIGLLPPEFWNPVPTDNMTFATEPQFSVKEDIAATIHEIAGHLTESERTQMNRTTAKKLVDMFDNIPDEKERGAVALSAIAAKGWYRDSAETIADIFGADSPRFVALLASLSPRTSVQDNLKNAISVWKGWVEAGRPVKAAAIKQVMAKNLWDAKDKEGAKVGVMPSWVPNTVRALSSDAPESIVLSGPKVSSFAANLRNEVHEVTLDSWMAAFDKLDALKFFKGKRNVKGTNPGKHYGYLAVSARVRQTAQYLTQKTGEVWTPAEVQETIWAWTKTLSELSAKYGSLSSAEEIVKNGELTNELVNATTNFATLFALPEHQEALRSLGYGDRLDRADGRAKARASSSRKAGPASGEDQERVLTAARRLDAHREENSPRMGFMGGARMDDEVQFSLLGGNTGNQDLDDFLGKFGAPKRTLRQWWQDTTENLNARIQMAVFDDLFGLLRAGDIAGLSAADVGYKNAQLAKSAAELTTALIEHGHPVWFKDAQANGAIHMIAGVEGGEGLIDILKPLGSKINLWAAWMVARRAQRLMGEGRENLFTPNEIAAALDLGNQHPEFQLVADRYAAFQKKVLDFAQEAGVIDPASRALWEHADYVPFYRIIENNSISGPGAGGALGKVRNQIRRLKGGKANLGDPLENIARNWHSLMDASLKAHAARTAVDALDGSGLVTRAPQVEMTQAIVPLTEVVKFIKANPLLVAHLRSFGVDPAKLPPAAFVGLQKMLAVQPPSGEDIISVWRNGKREYWHVHDEPLLHSLMNIPKAAWGPWMEFFRFPKRLFTATVTATPQFGLRNFWRDMLHSFVQGAVGRNVTIIPGWDSVKGALSQMRMDDNAIQNLAGGGGFVHGYIRAGDMSGAAKTIRRSLKKVGARGQVLNSPVKVLRFYRDFLNASENAHRSAIRERMLKAGASRLDATYEARDLLDFSKHGNHWAVNFIAQSVPFWNARLQGLHRLGRGAGGKKKVAFAIFMRGAMYTAAVLALLASQYRDPRYKLLTPSDKANFLHIFDWPYEGAHFKIPVPFEVGTLFGTVPMALFDYFYTNADEPDKAKQSLELVGSAIANTLNMRPDIRTIQPILELAINQDMFTKAPILTQGDESVLPEEQDDPSVRPTYRALARSMPDMAPDALRSPKQLQHLGRGYIGNVQDYLLMATDIAARRIMGEPKTAERQNPFASSFLPTGPPHTTKYSNTLFDVADQANEIAASINRLEKAETDQADKRIEELETENAPLLDVRKDFQNALTDVIDLKKEQRQIQLDPDMTPKEKQEEIDAIQEEINSTAEDVYDLRPGGKLNAETAAELIGASEQEQQNILRKAGLPATAAALAE